MRIGIPGTLPKSPSLRGPWVTGYFLFSNNLGTGTGRQIWFNWYWRRAKYGKCLYYRPSAANG